jgi:hypothetical protein
MKETAMAVTRKVRPGVARKVPDTAPKTARTDTVPGPDGYDPEGAVGDVVGPQNVVDDPGTPEEDEETTEEEQRPETDVYTPAPPVGRILEVGEPVVFDAIPTDYGMVLPKEDVYRRVYPRGATRCTYVHLVHKGVPVVATFRQ